MEMHKSVNSLCWKVFFLRGGRRCNSSITDDMSLSQSEKVDVKGLVGNLRKEKKKDSAHNKKPEQI